MPTTEQRIRNTQYFVGLFIIPFIFMCMFGQATLYPLVLNYNAMGDIFSTNWYITVLTFTLFVLLVCLYIAVRIFRDTFADFFF
jgi:membrane protein implicated in regulation of membrane protease activity